MKHTITTLNTLATRSQTPNHIRPTSTA